jgi:hypothetical protein
MKPRHCARVRAPHLLLAAALAALAALAIGCVRPEAPVLREAAEEEPPEVTARGLVRGLLRRGGPYELDGLDRVPPPRGGVPDCPRADLVTYRGLVLRYDAAVTVHPAFAERLIRFERLVREVGVEVYGRAPKTLHHGGAFACRTTKSGRMLSEHAYGNALDIEGFSFEPIAKADLERASARGLELAAAQKRAFRVRVGDTWRADGPEHAKRFFARLLERLEERDDIFRAVIGPPDPGHPEHLHVDVGRWAYKRYASPLS